MSAQTDFINRIAPVIVTYGKAYGYKVASPIIAQACVESAFGASKLASVWNNYWGMKAGSSWKGKSVNLSTKEEYTAGTLTTIKDNFRVYSSLEDGVNGYFDFISAKRYANLKTATTPKQYLEFIKADGYATSSTYVTTCMGVVDKYGLTVWDDFQQILTDTGTAPKQPQEATESDKNPAPYKIPVGVVKMGSKGNEARWVQFMLNRSAAYGLTVDGKIGVKSEAAIVHFQWKNGLQIDGKVGALTRAALMAGR